MDSSDSYTREDFFNLAKVLDKRYAISFPYSADGITSFMVFLSIHFEVLGSASFGGLRDGKMAVGILRRGFAMFDPAMKQGAGYVAEKLNLSEVDGEVIAELLNGIREHLIK